MPLIYYIPSVISTIPLKVKTTFFLIKTLIFYQSTPKSLIEGFYHSIHLLYRLGEVSGNFAQSLFIYSDSDQFTLCFELNFYQAKKSYSQNIFQATASTFSNQSLFRHLLQHRFKFQSILEDKHHMLGILD